MAFTAAAAMFGLQVGKTLLGAWGQSKASNIAASAAHKKLKNIDESIALTPEIAVAKEDEAVGDFNFSLGKAAFETSSMHDRLYQTEENVGGSTGFKFHGALESPFEDQRELVDQKYFSSRASLEQGLDKTLSGIEQWEQTELSKLYAERDITKAQKRYHKLTDTPLKALLNPNV